MTASVNGAELSRGRWSDAQFGYADMVARASADVRVCPGDLLGSGTVGTGSCSRSRTNRSAAGCSPATASPSLSNAWDR